MPLRTVVNLVSAHHQTEGGGFVVRRPLPTVGLELVDPFLLIDEMGPVEYGPGEAVGAPDHPHRGFETVTYLLEGEMEHEDSEGRRGHLAPGDVQWMTAGAGVVHSELPSERIRREGGRLHGFQIWVNLPGRDKMVKPRYQEIPSRQIPEAKSDRATVRVIAGEALGARAVIETHTPIIFQDWCLLPNASIEQPIPEDHNALAYVYEGAVSVGGTELSGGQLGVLGDGDRVVLSGTERGGRMLLLAGHPIGEPIARYGPFVMNNRAQILQAMVDYQSGIMGSIRRA